MINIGDVFGENTGVASGDVLFQLTAMKLSLMKHQWFMEKVVKSAADDLDGKVGLAEGQMRVPSLRRVTVLAKYSTRRSAIKNQPKNRTYSHNILRLREIFQLFPQRVDCGGVFVPCHLHEEVSI